MNAIDAAARLLAAKRRRAVPIADCYDIRTDPNEAFAIVPMRVVGEEVIQAVGYGDIRTAPNIVVEHHALSRRTSFLEPLAIALNDYLAHACVTGFPRIYVPHPAALEVLTILAARYERAGANPNPNLHVQGPSPLVVQLGYHCRLLKDIYHMPGQQIVVVMSEAIRRHFVTGQIPPKDGHLGALTVWLDAPAGSNTQVLADEKALEFPAAAMLPRHDDEAVEKKLHELKKTKEPAQRQLLQADIEAKQRGAVNAEWQLLQEAHHAFWGQNLTSTRHERITSENVEWLRYRLATPIARARRAVAMSQRYEMHEYHNGLHQGEMIAQDGKRFEQQRASGRAFRGSIIAVRKTPRGINPKNHQVDIAVENQPKIRLRAGREIQIVGGKIVGEIVSFMPTASGYSVTLKITEGVNSLFTGGPHRWTEALPGDLHRINDKYHRKIKQVLGLG